MAKITRTQQRRLVATSIAFILTAAMMMPTATDARGSGHGGGHGGGHGVRHIGILGFPPRHVSPAQPGFSVARRTFRHHGNGFTNGFGSGFGPNFGFGSGFYTLGADGMWIDGSGSTPSIVVTQPPTIVLGPPAPSHTAVVRTPGAEQEGILVVRGTSKAYVTFPNATSG